MQNKTGAGLEILSMIPEETLQSNKEYLALLGFNQEGNWEVIVKYNGDIEEVVRNEGGTVQRLNKQFAVINIPKENIKNLVEKTEIEYIEVPKRMVYTQTTNMSASCITSVQNLPPYELKGKGVLLGIIDSGINYRHPDFRNDDGTTRIAALWDQTISGNPPEGFLTGTEYTREQINEALRANSKLEGLQIVPSEDTVGHGTHVAGIAGGNGRGSNQRIVGAAPEAEFIIVKLGQPDFEGFVRNVEIMLAVRYVLEKAVQIGRPVAINISIGMNTGPHDGTALIEQYLDDAATVWKTNIVVGTGNEAVARNHLTGKVKEGATLSFEFQIGEGTTLYNMSIWQQPIDVMAFSIIAPDGRRTPKIVYSQGTGEYRFGNTKVYTSYAGPSPLSGNIEFAIFLEGVDGNSLMMGNWTVVVYGEEIVDGTFKAWGPTTESGADSNFFLTSSIQGTFTTPSTATGVTSVAAYNHNTGQIAPFSGRGYVLENEYVKPDIAAPGVEIQAPSHTTNGYRTLSGTSMATPHVTGGIALIMEWGIVEGNNPYLYGENLRTYLIRGAKRDLNITYPNDSWGYGKLCIENSLDLLRRQLILG